ncbi:saccharopine dehydrogenase NADP-binding domain-containing protein [Phytomonospora sp. NPDC050363]|uniref:saccharopine dehydrogenase NADP-binding domain-containing protein n=1 Tax=Phytomonospora sp. NPDC050363 TaxID=3155642 RepID=UPI0033E1DC55
MKIAVYGASGHVGRFAVEELRRREVATVLVGRDAERLKAAAERAGAAGAEIRVAGAHDHDALTAAFADVDAVVSTLPDYTGNGEGVVRAAIAAGAHYVDVAGEQLFVRKIFDEYGEAAAKAGVTLVTAVTEAGVFADLLTVVAAERLGGADEVVLSHVASGEGSRGSMRTVFNNLDVFLSGGLSWSEGGFVSGPKARREEFELPDGETVAVRKFPQPGVVTIPRHTKAGAVEGVLATAILDVVKDVTEADLAAAPEAPDKPAAYQMVVDVYRNGHRLRGIGSGPDTYRNSGQMSVDVALRLVAGAGKPGAHSTAELFAPVEFLDSLKAYDMEWSLTG